MNASQAVPKVTASALWPLMMDPARWGRNDLCAVSANGVRIHFADGHEVIDGSSGLWNCNLGYGNVAIRDAVAAALTDASYLGVWGFENDYARRASDALVDLAGSDHYGGVLFSTSGGAANDLAMKLVRHYQAIGGHKERRIIVGLWDGYHGLTFGAAALTTAQLGQDLYAIDRRFVAHVHANETEGLESLVRRGEGRIAGIVVEPVMGTAGVALSGEFLDRLFALRREFGFLIVADEISTGFGRIGNAPFESATWVEQPDVLLTGKGLTNGTMAASAVVVSRALTEQFRDASAVLGHAETFAGTPSSCAAVVATVGEFHRLDLVAKSARLSNVIDVEFKRLLDATPMVVSVSGRGCLRAIHVADTTGAPLDGEAVSDLVDAVHQAGVLLHPGPSCLLLVPSLVMEEEDMRELMTRVSAGICNYFAGAS